jgi:serine/threonine-protein phosphatase 2B regulatory subunit
LPFKLNLQRYNVDRDGLISLSDLETIVKHLVGSSLNEEQVAELITRAMARIHH